MHGQQNVKKKKIEKKSVFYTPVQFGGAACVNIRIPWWWHLWSTETCRKETVYRLCFLFSAWKVGRVELLDLIKSKKSFLTQQ